MSNTQYLSDEEFSRISKLTPAEFNWLADDVKERFRRTSRRNFEARMGDEDVTSWKTEGGETYREFLDNLTIGSLNGSEPPDGSGYR